MSDNKEKCGIETQCIIKVEPGRSRKRKRFPDAWRRNVAKRARHRPKGLPKKLTCEHENKGHFQCKNLSLQDIRRIQQKFYQQPDHEWQNNFLLQHVSVVTPMRSCTSAGIPSRRKVSTNFSLSTLRQNVIKNTRVCRAAFLEILQVGRDRVNRLRQIFLTTGSTPTGENQGSDRRSQKYELKRETVKIHNKTLSLYKAITAAEKHNPEDLHVQYDYYRTIFNAEFNIGFGSPYVDKCSTCCQLESKISAERITTVKKNLALPKIPDQVTYYAKQLYLYKFIIYQGSSKSSQTKDNTFCYVWTENEFSKGSNQIASVVHHRLINTNMDMATTVRLFSDGCGGQNKNKTVIAMILHWFLLETPLHIEEIDIWFPIVGHSFKPPDRIFGHLEREFHSRSVIETPDEYVEVIKKCGTVTHLGEDSKLCDVKRLLVLHFGKEWDSNQKLEFLKNVFEEESFPTEGLNEDEESEEPLDFDLLQDD
ncbi:hypothetical protein PR048_017203 [Dryococelus australis]|uniref:DUF7869 domain-containing protein n=1 Tax=Dryococelus australis TaxID=614101 RepID=A0ABQ9H9H7_9NEOP|nr:hypothetical protein PR048_017203 [Dryococelus australis]